VGSGTCSPVTAVIVKLSIASDSYVVASVKYRGLARVAIQGLACGANLWFGGFPYPVNPGRPEWSKVQRRGKPLVATAQVKYMSAGER